MQSLHEIKKTRKKYHLGQKELAQRAGVSQSLIAKIEAGSVDPSYTNAQKIFRALDDLRAKTELKAFEVMKTRVYTVHGEENVKQIVKLMKNYKISQMPVLRGNQVVGIVTEGTLLNAMLEKGETFNLLTAEDLMDDTPPIIGKMTSIRIVLELLRDAVVVLVAEKGEIQGIISKTDLLGRIEEW